MSDDIQIIQPTTIKDDMFYIIQSGQSYYKKIYMKLPGQPIVEITKYVTDLYINNQQPHLPHMSLSIRGDGLFVKILE